MFAVIETGGKQYLVQERQVLRIEKLPPQVRNEGTVVFNNVLLVSDGEQRLEVGRPTLTNAHVEARILRDGKAHKVRVVKYKPKVRYRRMRGHRQAFTEVRIEKIAVS